MKQTRMYEHPEGTGTADERLFTEQAQCDECEGWTDLNKLKPFGEDECCPHCIKKELDQLPQPCYTCCLPISRCLCEEPNTTEIPIL